MLSEGYFCRILYHDLLNYNLCSEQGEDVAHEMTSLNDIIFEEKQDSNMFWSICKNYNDLHIAGGQVMPVSSVKTDFNHDSGIGPFLESSEIPPPMESISVPPTEVSRKPTQGHSSCWRVASIMQHQQPLSNSILNNYLEEKVVELYKQYIMDGMGNSASPTQILASEFIMTNVDQISMKLSQERNMKTTKAKDVVISCLLRLASEKAYTEMSTPSLHISQFSTITK
uniref:Uncharacterized protein n=1 Tax=Sphaerodactylus townsendi TaxID=933632 RepID=A0ACB8FI70_9SAUR